jgi:hypothetical protein
VVKGSFFCVSGSWSLRRSDVKIFSEDGSAACDLTRWPAANTYLKSRPPIIDESNFRRDFCEQFSGIQTFVAV